MPYLANRLLSPFLKPLITCCVSGLNPECNVHTNIIPHFVHQIIRIAVSSCPGAVLLTACLDLAITACNSSTVYNYIGST